MTAATADKSEPAKAEPAKAKLRRAKKAAPKRGKKKEPVEVTPELLAQQVLFEFLPSKLLSRLAPRTALLELDRGEHLLDGAPGDDEESPVFVLLRGDVSVTRRQTGTRDEILNFVQPGQAYVQKLFCDGETERIRLTAMCPVKALRLKYRDVNYLLKKNDEFRDAFSAAIREVTERQIECFDDDFQRDIAQFFVEQRLTFSGRVKIKRMDICIECDGCYDACRERHGTDRLGPSEVKYGLTEIPQNCHNCLVPECIDKCKFGHITFHEETGEIVIADNCTGCTQCSRGCSFGAIRMHSLEDLDLERYFPNRSPDAKGKNIAQKCDNCTGYDEQACITACPTGALFQVEGGKILDYWQQFTVHREPGAGGVVSPEGHPRGWRWFWIVFMLLNSAALTWECFGRLHWPHSTFTAILFRAGWFETGLDLDSPFRAGDRLSHSLGYIGGSALVATQLYRLGKWMAPRWGSVQVWMEAHIFLGLLGGIYGFFHTAFYFSGVVSTAAFVTMVIAIVTGIVGRYLVFLVPRSQAGQQLELNDIEEQVHALNKEIEECFDDPRAGFEAVSKLDASAADGESKKKKFGSEGEMLFTSIVRLAEEDRESSKRIEAVAGELAKTDLRAGRKDELVKLLKNKARLERSVRRHALLASVLKRYRVVHVVSSNIMFGALASHIIVSLIFTVGN